TGLASSASHIFFAPESRLQERLGRKGRQVHHAGSRSAHRFGGARRGEKDVRGAARQSRNRGFSLRGGRRMKWGVVRFPGSLDDGDALHALAEVMGQDARILWHKDEGLGGVECVLLPGGFSYGDYLRTGAIARFS